MKFIYTGLILLSTFNVSCQTEKINKLNAELIGIRMITDGFSRYSEPKISPKGTKVLTTKNRDTLIYIDLINNKEINLMTGSRFAYYCWIDTNTIYYYKISEKNSNLDGELGKLTIKPISKSIEFNFSSNRSGSGYSGRIPYLKNGKHDIYFDLKRDKVYLMDNGEEIEITHQEGEYYRTIISNKEDRVIIHKNDGKAYNYDFNGSGEYILVTRGLVSTWSPKDKYLLYFRDFGGDGGDDYKSELYICTSDGMEHQQLTFSDEIREFDSDWAKQSNKIAFIDNKKYQIYTGEIVID